MPSQPDQKYVSCSIDASAKMKKIENKEQEINLKEQIAAVKIFQNTAQIVQDHHKSTSDIHNNNVKY